jgi:hypothetical protein
VVAFGGALSVTYLRLTATHGTKNLTSSADSHHHTTSVRGYALHEAAHTPMTNTSIHGAIEW